MPNDTRVFISHAHEDAQTCVPLVAALDAWEIPYFFDTSPAGTTPILAPNVQQALTDSTIFIRVCTRNTNASIPVNLESNAFRGLQAQQRRKKRTLINLILDTGYQREPFDNATLFIDGTTKSRFDWLSEIARALGITTVGRRVSRRSTVALGVAGAVALASATSAGVVLERNRPSSAPKSSRASVIAGLSGQAKWSQSAGKYSPPSVTVADNVAYVFSDIGLVALSATNGKTIWNQPQITSQGTVPIAVAAAGGSVYAVDGQGQLWALNSSDGSERWKIQAGQGQVSAPVVSGNTVYLVQDDGAIHAYKLVDGSTLWQADIGSGAIDMSTLAQSWPVPTIDAGVVYAGSANHYLYALDARDGSVKWKFLARGRILSTPAVTGDRVYFGSEDTTVYAVSASDGKLVWSYQTGGDIISSPAVVNGIVYIGARDMYLYALDSQHGYAYWRSFAGDLDPAGINTKGDQVNCLPVVSRDAVYITAGALLYSFQITDGKRLWRFQSGASNRTSSPVLAGNVVLIGADNNTVYAVNI